MYRRADLSRTMMLVVALFATVASTSIFAREFRAVLSINRIQEGLESIPFPLDTNAVGRVIFTEWGHDNGVYRFLVPVSSHANGQNRRRWHVCSRLPLQLH